MTTRIIFLLPFLLSSASDHSIVPHRRRQDVSIIRARLLPQPSTTGPPPMPLEEVVLDCPGSPQHHLQTLAHGDGNERSVERFLVRYLPLVDGLVKFSRKGGMGGRCRMKLNHHLKKQIDASAVFHYHLFTTISHVRRWNCPGNFADVANFLASRRAKLADLGISRIYFVVLATERQFRSFYSLHQDSMGPPPHFVWLAQSPARLDLQLPNPFQDALKEKEANKPPKVVHTQKLPLCHLKFPNRTAPETRILEAEKPLFTGPSLLTLKSVSLVAAGGTACVVVCVACCLAACWWEERRERRHIVYKGLHHPTLDYTRSYLDLARPPSVHLQEALTTLERDSRRKRLDRQLDAVEREPLRT